MRKSVLFHTAASLLFTTSTIAQTNKIENTGTVGIGTLSPQDMLSIVTSSGSDGIGITSTFTLGAGSGAYLRLYNAGTPNAANQRLGGMLFGTNPTGTTRRTGAQIQAFSEAAWTDGSSHPTYLHFLTAAPGSAVPSERMRITANGNVGIGTQTPTQKLEVNGNGKFNGAIYSSIANANIGGFIALDNPSKTAAGTASSWRIYNMSGSYGNSLQFWAYDNQGCGGGLCTSRLTLMDNGNVGIGTTTPGSYKLAVEGTIGARKVKVTQAAWADFVFEPEYPLPSLAELEAFIHMNKHLPDVPTEKEVTSEGLDLGEMNKKLLQKIEELTLYLIEENKKNKEQQEMIEAMKAELAQLKAKVQ